MNLLDSRDVIERFKVTSSLMTHIKTLVELNLDFLAIEKNVFSLGMTEGDIQAVYGNRSNLAKRNEVAQRISDQLHTFCLTVGQAPYIRYFKGPSSDMPQLVAEQLYDSIKMSARKLKGGPNTLLRESVLLIVDRSVDCIAPVLHEFTYQAMACDLLDIGEDNIYVHRYVDGKGEEQTRTIMLDENDPIWISYRHRHIAEARPELNKELKAFLEENRDIREVSERGKQKDARSISNIIHKLPQYQESFNRYSLHVGMMRDVMNIFNEQNLKDIALWEQNMAMGTDPEGREIRNPLSSLKPLFADSSISTENKQRLMAAYIISQGGFDERKLSKLQEMAKLDNEEFKAIENLSLLGVRQSKSKGVISSIFKKLSGKRKQGDGFDYHLSRYTPAVKTAAQEIIKGALNMTEYPYVGSPPSFTFLDEKRKSPSSIPGVSSGTSSLRSKSGARSLRKRESLPAWVVKKAEKNSSSRSSSPGSPSGSDSEQLKSDKKLYIFVIGGVMHSEIRTAYELQSEHGVEVIIGGTSIVTPVRFLQKLGKL